MFLWVLDCVLRGRQMGTKGKEYVPADEAQCLIGSPARVINCVYRYNYWYNHPVFL